MAEMRSSCILLVVLYLPLSVRDPESYAATVRLLVELVSSREGSASSS